jgi:tryptophan-rich sensory protein
MSVLPGPGWGPVLVAGAAAFAILGTGGALTEIGPWYRGLKKPSWQPPDWLFAPMWSAIYIFATWAAVLAWNHATSPAQCAYIIVLFALNGALNILWSLLFFKTRRPDWALIEVIALWLSILWLVVELHAITPRAGYLMLPYLAWVTIAACLNTAIVRLNNAFA